MAGCSCVTRACRAGARTCAIARRRSRCTCCGGCSLESRRSNRARLFVALDLPADARAALVTWRGTLEHPDLRLVSPEALHVTLVFLGHLDEELIPRIAELIQPPVVEAPLLTATGVKAVPPRR